MKESRVFSSDILKTCIMSPTELAEAENGNCPYCHIQLIDKTSNNDIKFMFCEDCNIFYVLEK